MNKVILETIITKIGANAADFLAENMLIFFHEDVPPYLADFCYLIQPGSGSYEIRVGDVLKLNEAECLVTAIGDVALKNFQQLGHLTVRFDGSAEAAQPGTIHVQSPKVPPLAVGTRVQFTRSI